MQTSLLWSWWFEFLEVQILFSNIYFQKTIIKKTMAKGTVDRSKTATTFNYEINTPSQVILI